MRRHRGAPLDNPVQGSNEVLFGHNYIRKGSVHHDPDLPETLEPTGERRAEMVNEGLSVEKVAHTVDVMFVFEDPREFPNDLFVLFFLHWHSSRCITFKIVNRSVEYMEGLVSCQ